MIFGNSPDWVEPPPFGGKSSKPEYLVLLISNWTLLSILWVDIQNALTFVPSVSITVRHPAKLVFAPHLRIRTERVCIVEKSLQMLLWKAFHGEPRMKALPGAVYNQGEREVSPEMVPQRRLLVMR